MTILSIARAGTVALLISSIAQAASDPTAINENPLHAQAKFVPETTAPGGTTELRIDIRLDEGHHAYLERFKVAIDSPDGAKVDAFHVDPIVKFKDAVSGEMKDGVEKQATLRATVEIPASASPAQQTAQIRFTYQACTEDHCLFPKTIPLEASLRVGSAAEGYRSLDARPSIGAPSPSVAGSGGSDFESALGRGTLSALAFVFVIGFLTSLTPCIYPMIPITLAVLGARAKEQSRARGLALSVTYVLGIAVTYSALGVAAASTGALFGHALGNVYVVSAIALIFAAMGVSMYGAFELQAPAFLRDRLGVSKGETGFIGAFLTGLVAGVVASPCVGPVLVGVLAYIAQTQDRFLGFLFLFTFACGMGVLFVALGAFSQLIGRIPKSGPWMDGVKFVFGTTMIGMALYYIKPVYPDWAFQAIAGAALIGVASSFGAFEANASLTPWTRLRKGAMQAAFFVGVGFVAVAALARFASLPEIVRAEGGRSSVKLDWKPFTDEALAEALAARKPVILDFSADWCASCKELEKFTFVDPRIRERSAEFALLTIDATKETPFINELQRRFSVVGLPTMIFFDVQGRRRDDLTVTGFETAEPFLARMDKALRP